jgi:RHS repeat-associated protein
LSVTDAISGIQKGTNAYTYDILNRVTKLTQSGNGVTSKRVDMTYNAVNQIATLNRYGDLTGTSAVANSSYTYDLAGRLQTLTHQHGANTLASYGLTYDNANRIIQSSGTDGIQDYTYDSTNQLTTADHTTQTDEAYSYDANGNRTNTGYGTGTNNQLLTDGTYNYEYDGEGNRTKRTEIGTGKVTEYNWDYRNRLTSVVFKDAAGNVTKTIEYLYDVDDRRIGKKIDGVVTERYVYDGLHIALVFDGTGNQTHRYLYGTEVDQILADETPTQVLWALTDRQGSVKDLVDENGVILNHINYDSFGKVVSQTDASVEFRYGYTGREQDAETGLDYYRARYYDSTVGEFISEDPLGFNAGDTNLTRYVLNSPTNYTDPSGNIPIVFGGLTLLQWLGIGAVGVGTYGTLNQINNQSHSVENPRSINPKPVVPGYCNEEPPPDCKPDSGRKLTEKLTDEVLQNLMDEAANIRKTGKILDKGWGDNNNVAVGISESGKIYVSTTNGRYPSKKDFGGSAQFQKILENRGYIVVKGDGGLSATELDANGNQKQWHAEGRLIQNGINKGDRIVAIGVSDRMCPSCAKDIEKYNIKTLNGKYTSEEYKKRKTKDPGKRPNWEKRPKDSKCK